MGEKAKKRLLSVCWIGRCEGVKKCLKIWRLSKFYSIFAAYNSYVFKKPQEMKMKSKIILLAFVMLFPVLGWANDFSVLEKSMKKIERSTDGVSSALADMKAEEARLRASGNSVSAAIYDVLLCQLTSDSISAHYRKLALSDIEALASAKAKHYKSVVKILPMGKYFADDMLSVIGFELGEYDLLRKYYSSKGNRNAVLLCELEMLKLKKDGINKDNKLHALDSLASVCSDRDLGCEIAIMRYDCLPRQNIKARYDFLTQNITKFASSSRVAVLKNSLAELSQPVVNAYCKMALLSTQDSVHIEYEYKNLKGAKLNFYKTNLSAIEVNDYNKLDRERVGISGLMKAKQIVDKKSYDVRFDAHPDQPYAWFNMTNTYPPLSPGVWVYELVPDVKLKKGKGANTDDAVIYVSDLRTVVRCVNADSLLVTVVNAITGQPVTGVKIGSTIEDCLGVTDSAGELVVDDCEGYFPYTDADKGCPQLGYIGSSFDSLDTANLRVDVFTDRGLYRPGQTVHVAAVAHTREKSGKFQVVPGKKVVIEVRDARFQKVDSLVMVTDDMGAASATYTIPANCILGQWTLRNSYSTYLNFDVAEYKRPTFDVRMLPCSAPVVLGDTVNLKCEARSFSGAPIAYAQVVAKVDYEVVGTLFTDADGMFTYRIPTAAGSWSRSCNVQFFVTSASGETQRVEKTFWLSNTAFKASIDCTSKPLHYIGNTIGWATFEKSEVKGLKFVVNAQNAFLEKVDGVEYKIWKKGEEQNCFCVKSGEEFYWPLGNDVECGEFAYNYTAEHCDTSQIIFTVFDPLSTKPCADMPIWLNTSADVFSGSEPVTVAVGSSMKGVCMLYSVNNRYQMLEHGVIELTDTIVMREFVYRPEYGDGIQITYSFWKDNRFYARYVFIDNENTTKLDAEWSTVRDELVPGSDEEWRVRITNEDGSPAMARMIATMYDASLNRIEPFKWQGLSTYITHNIEVVATNDLEDYNSVRHVSGDYKTLDVAPLLYSRISCETFGVKKRTRILVVDENLEPVIGASVHINGEGYATGYKGECNAMLKVGDLVTVKYIGYESQVVRYMGYPLVVHLSPSEMLLEEVVVSGLEGRVAGVAVSTNYRAFTPTSFGTAPTIMVRGASSLRGACSFTGTSIMDDSTPSLAAMPLRENFNETAFFMPALATDANGEVCIRFKVPDCLTEWNFNAVAYDKNVRNVDVIKKVVAKKNFMVQPNMPRFIRVGDEATITARIVNTCEANVDGMARIELIDPETEQVVFRQQVPFHAAVGGESVASFVFNVSEAMPQLLKCRIVGQAGKTSDGEVHYLPILPAKELVTISKPFLHSGSCTKHISLQDMMPVKDGKFVVEYTENPSWLMIQALKTLSDPSDECAICQAIAFYSQTIVNDLLNSSDDIAEVVAKWSAEADSLSLGSKLEQNVDVRNVLLEEAPWAIDAKSEAESKRRLAQFLNSDVLDGKSKESLNKLRALQNSDGSWSWWKGMKGDYNTTLTVTTLLVRLSALCGNPSVADDAVGKAMNYLAKQGASTDYLYLCAIGDMHPADSLRKDVKKLVKNLKKSDFRLNDVFTNAQIAIILHHNKEEKAARNLLQNILDLSVCDAVHGRRFDSYLANYSWLDYKIPTQVMVIEALKLVMPEEKTTLQEMLFWLLQEKRTQNWITSIASANAVYAFSMGNDSEKLQTALSVRMKANGKVVDLSQGTAGLGYVRTDLDGGTKVLSIDKTSEETSWGAVYAQYFQNAAEVADTDGDIMVNREIIASHKGALKVGDKVRVRITITSKRDLDYVQILDKRPACLEPVKQASGYDWRGGYYCNSRDCSTVYFISMLPKGTRVIEKEFYIDRAGTYTSGTTTVQCAYAPEFSATAKSTTITVVP